MNHSALKERCTSKLMLQGVGERAARIESATLDLLDLVDSVKEDIPPERIGEVEAAPERARAVLHVDQRASPVHQGSMELGEVELF